MNEQFKPEHQSTFSGSELAKELETMKVQEGVTVPRARISEDEAVKTESEPPQPHEYEYLRHGMRGPETDAELRARYVLYTDKLIGFARGEFDPNGEVGPDGLKDTGVTFVFLDKSARPVSWFVSEFWDLYAPGYRKPEMKFINVDREHWQKQTGRIDPDTGRADVDVSRLPDEVFDQLRQTYRDPDDPDQSVFTGRRVIIVDETRTTGTTLEIARQMFVRAFPDAESISEHHWMVRPRGDLPTSDVPVWYNKYTPYGRGVGDRDLDILQLPEEELKTRNQRQVEGALFLSTRHDRPDVMAAGLRKEIHNLREDVLSGAMRFSVLMHEDEEIAPELLKAVAPWREKQRAENMRRR